MTPSGKGWCALYARFSTDKQNRMSTEDQLRMCREAAAARGLRVVAEYADGGESGTHIDRGELRRLMADAEAGRFEEVIVENGERLSRDLGNTMEVVFADLHFHGVRVYDLAKRVASDDPHGRLSFQVGGIVSEQYIESVRLYTRRGLRARAQDGFATGGPRYGYSSIPEPAPADPERPRKLLVVYEPEAAVVRRIFKMWVEGHALKKITLALNGDGIPAPRDGRHGNKHGKGWGHTTVRSILQSERYIGRFVWNTSEWKRHPKKRQRKRLRRPESQWVKTDKPELAIIDAATWEAAQARFKVSKRGRPYGAGARDGWLLSGLCRCAECGSGISIFSRKKKGNREFARVRCAAVSSRGTCKARCVTETGLVRQFVEKLRTILTKPGLAQAFVAGFTDRTKELAAQATAPGADTERRVQEAQKAVDRLTGLLLQHQERTGELSEAPSQTGWWRPRPS